ncbi:MAG: hypothetical protein LAP40_01690 [Acidobacteriia bacterium]|nr:hypothetical protein [Terriglobia bacterium]
MRLACLMLACLPLFAQTSGVLPVTKAPGDEVTLEVSATSQPANAPIVLKWDVIFPAQVMDLETVDPGSAATHSGKSLQCTARKPYLYACVLSGGQNPIENGLIVTYRFKIKSTAPAGSTTLRVENAESTTADSKKWTLNPTGTIVIVR